MSAASLLVRDPGRRPPLLTERLQRDVSMRRRQIQRHGTLPMLTNLHSDISWPPRTASGEPGRGLILAPCLFGQ